MKTLKFSVLALVIGAVAILGVSRFSRPATEARAPAAASNVAKSTAAAAQNQVNPSHAPAERTETADTPVPTAQATKVPTTTSSQDAFIQNARVLAERANPPTADGRQQKTRLLEVTGSKYPFVRSEEIWKRDATSGEEQLESRQLMVADHVMIKLSDNLSKEELETFLAAFGAKIRRQVGQTRNYLVATPEVSLESFEITRDRLRGINSPAARVESDYVVSALLTPNDPSYSKLWGLNNFSQTGGTGDADIDAPEAWDVSRGNAAIVVGIIDTGIDYTHPDLAANIWTNPGEIPGNGIDDDHNGYIDDVRGWDFVNNDSNPMDDHYHGTHCAGTIGAVGNNGIGVVGVAHTVKMMALKFLSSSGSGFTSDAVEAVAYATHNGAHLTSNSWGGGGYSQALKDAIDDAADAGVLFVAAAGNSSANNDYTSNYPSSYISPNIIAVAATDHNDQLAYFSSYGASSVHLSAPGVDIYSTSPGNSYRYLSGTSMATPHVAGAAALLLSVRPDWHWAELKNALLKSVDPVTALRGKVSTGGRLNIGRALLLNNGPYVSVLSVTALDTTAAGAVGNGDGVISPGEDIAIRISLQNGGNAAALNVNTNATIIAGASSASLLRSTSSWGNLAVGEAKSNNALPLLVRISSTAVTPLTFTVRLTTSTSTGTSWSTEASFTANRVSTIQGRVIALTGSAPVAGAIVVAKNGSITTQAVTNSTGVYQLSVLDGTYSVEASAASFNTSAPLSVQVPPSRQNIDFALGRSRLQVSPAAINSAQLDNVTTTHTVTLTNSGDLPLTVSISGASVSAANAARGILSVDGLSALGTVSAEDQTGGGQPISALATAAALPIDDDFEDGTLDGWVNGYGVGDREVVSTFAANGTRSFHFRNRDNNAHYNGIQSELAAGSQPGYVSFWVRPGTTTEASGYVVLGDGIGDTIVFYAKENGRLQINADTGGDSSYPYSAGVWYHIEFRNVDWTNRRFDYYVNGTAVKLAVPFRRASTEVRRVYLYNFSSGAEAWWDDVRLLEHGAGWLTYSPRSLTLAPGQSLPVTVSLNSTDLAAATYQGRLEFISNDAVTPRSSLPITLTVEVVPNTPPLATSQTLTSAEDTPLTITLSGSDAEGGPLTAIITALPASGTLYQTLDGTTPGAAITDVPAAVADTQRRVIFVPAPNAFGAPLATFKFTLMDRRIASIAATVTLNVTSVNDAPLAYDDAANATPGTTLATLSVLANDIDVEGDTLSIQSFTQGTRGIVSSNGNGTLRYVPSAGFTSGSDQFTYTVSDGKGGTATARVTIIVGYMSAGNWPMMGGNAGHSSYYAANLGTGAFAKNWSLAYGRTLNQASIAEGRVFVTPSIYFNDTYVSAVNLSSGVEAWRKTFTTARSLTGPSYIDGAIYLQRGNHSSDSQLWAINAKTGATIWSTPFLAQWETYQPPTVSNLYVFTNGGSYGGIYGYTRATGAQMFFKSLPQVDGWTPAYLPTIPYSFVGGVFTAHDISNGAVIWSLTPTAGVTSGARTIAISDSKAYVIGQLSVGTELLCIDLVSRKLLWRVTSTNMTGSVAVGPDAVYVIQNEGIRAYNSSTGAVIRTYSTGTEIAGYQPIVTNDTLIAASNDKVWIWTLSTGELRQTLTPGGIVSLADGNLIVAGYSGNLECYGVSGIGRTPPVALAQTVSGTEDQTSVITLQGTDADGDSLNAIVTALPTVGSLYQTSDGTTPGALITAVPAVVTNPQRIVIYRPVPDDFGTARAKFSFRVADVAFNSAAADVTINLAGVNDAPIAMPDAYRLRPGSPSTTFNPLANDIDVDGDNLTFVSTTTPARGTLVRAADEMLSYTPNADFTSGTDTFNYTIKDASGVTSTTSVTIEITTSVRNDWPTLGGSPAHEGYYLGSLGTAQFTELWTYNAQTSVNAPAVANGRIYLTVKGNFAGYTQAIALDTATGAESWRSRFLPAYSLNPPSWFGGRVHFQRCNNSSDTFLYALNDATGALVWQTPFGSQWENWLAPAIDAEGIYINGGTYGGIYGFNTSTGAQYFSLGLEQTSGWTPTLANGGLYSYVGTKLRSHNRTTGAVLWLLDLGGSTSTSAMNRTIAVSNGIAFLVNNLGSSQELVAIDLAKGAVKWRVGGTFSGTPAVANGVVYAASTGRVISYNSGSGRLLREYVAPSESALLKTPVLTDDLLLVSGASKTYFFNLSTRAVIQTVNVASEIAVADDSIVLVGSDNIVRRFGRASSNNRAPVASALRFDIREEASVSIQLTGTDADGDALSYVVRTLPAKGRLYQTSDGTTKGDQILSVPALVRHFSGSLIYDAPLDVFGQAADGFTYTANDYATASATAAITINIAPINDAPIAMPDTLALRPGQVLTNFRPEQNDRDVDGDVLTVTSFTQPANGTVARSADGTLQYTPNAGFIEGDDTFNYTISDPEGLTSSATVTLIVSASRGRDWTTFGADANHSGYRPVLLAGSAFTQRWVNNLGTSIRQVTVADNRVYAAGYATTLWKLSGLDAGSGSRIWSVDYSGYTLNPPAFYNGKVVTQGGNSSSSRIFSVRADTGAADWSSPFAAQWENYLAPTIDATGIYVNAGYFGGIYRFNRDTGAQTFFLGLDQYDGWTPLRHQGGLYSFVKGIVRSHNPDTGAVLKMLTFTWNWAGYTMNRTIAAENGIGYLVNDAVTIPAGGRDLTAINLADLTVRWTVADTKFVGTPAVANGVVYVNAGGSVNAYTAADGRFVRSYVAPLETALSTQPIVTSDSLIAYSTTKTYVFNLFDGTLRQTIPFGGRVSLAGETLYIANDDGNIRAFGIPNPLNHPPLVQPVAVSTNEDTPVAVNLSATDADGDATTISITRLPTQGRLHWTTDGVTPGAAITTVPSLVGPSPTRVLYVPPQDTSGNNLGDFGYAASDGLTQSTEAAVNLTVVAINDAPVAENDSRVIQPGQILSPIREIANDLDVDGDPLTIVSFTQPASGVVSVNQDGTLRYEPAKGVTTGRTSFNYTIADPAGLQSTATVTIDISNEITGSWPTQGGNRSRTGYAPVTLGHSAYSVRWSRTIGTSLNPVAVGDGKVYATAKPSTGSVLVALDERSGEQKWSRPFTSNYSLNPPTFDRGLVYVQRGNYSGDSQLWAISADNGTPFWNAPFATQWESYLAPLVMDEGVFINGGSYGGIYGYQRTTGAQRFFVTLQQKDRWTPAASPAGEVLSFVGGVLSRHDPLTGVVAWSVNLGWGGYGYSMNRTIAIEERRAFVINDSPSAAYSDEDLVAVDLDTRSSLWSINGEFTGTPAVAQGIVYAISANTVQARSVINGRLLGTYSANTGEALAGQPIVTEDLVIVASAQRTYLFARHDRTLLQTLPAGGAISVADDQILVADPASGVLRAYATQPAISFTPAGGTFAQPVNITLGAREAGARIYYTLDGSAPDLTSPWVSSGASVLMKWTGKVRAIMVSGSGVSRINEVTVTMIDSDADGLPDWWEKDQFGSLNNTTGNTDSDGDGATDADEFTAGTNPLDRGDAFAVRSVRLGGSAGISAFDFGASDASGLSISWDSKSDRYYTVEASNNLQTWTTVGTPYTGNGYPLSYTHPSSGSARVFLRVRVQPLLIDTTVP